ncbi:MAG: iron-containing alcohol dehydrogenase, partial [Verrucomicrobiales bacterium]|nr:iron-containing alcohol dehydrogenase [Verrucomicrobiales bacterium]
MSSGLDLEDLCTDFSIPEHVRSFEHAPGTRVRFGPGVLDSIGNEGAALGKRAMIVTDEGLVEAGYVGRAVRALTTAGLEVTVFSSVHENPTTADVRATVGAAKDAKIDLLIGLGGGSSMD